ncbi:peptidyl-tRNA hydrolase 2 [Magnaporthiopsis poae ATCC 64411]|uniref:peptidyl-tRNA hydrolase n=1 Tax=Magnaporthiopsis poae (strain ATCC 64411 / 73-15) TaxID=644358 RepID=A0A0C4EDT8_MAGP6|nr:peptidyl-tRNA hydrolase 2 [Magnaporthiopsis poae ATCC 64411]
MSCASSSSSSFSQLSGLATDKYSSSVIVSTSVVALISGFLLGVYSIRGYLISPALVEERRRFAHDPIESDESDIDEDDTILDHAPNWSNGVDADRRDGLRATAAGIKKEKVKEKNAPAAAADSNEECKLVLVVRTDLGMTKGKIAAQCGHATLACYKTLSKAAQRTPGCAEAKVLHRWERQGQAKIAVQTKSQDEMMTLLGQARSLGITAEVIQDAGRTQIEAGSMTVLGVGPAPKSLVDKVTGHLKLL